VSIDLPLEAFIDTEQGRSYGAMYCDYFASLDPRADFTTDAAIRKAIENLEQFAVVGFLDDLDGFAAGIRREFGFRPRIGHRNRNAAAPTQNQRGVSAALLKRVEVVCGPDLEVFHAARARARAA
jgi:hypothetical protein